MRLCAFRRAGLLLCAALIAAVCGSGSCRAQAPQVLNWTTEDGLPQNSVHALLQASDGYLWLATEGGVARFNGLRFQSFSSANEPAFQSDDSCCIAEGSPGELFFGTASGVVLLRDGAFHSVAGTRGEVLDLQPEAGGRMLVLTSQGLYGVRGDVASPVKLGSGQLPRVLGHAADGSVLAVVGTALLRVRGDAVETAGTLPADVRHLAEDATHRMWTATASSVELRDARLQVVRRWRVGQELPGSRVELLRLWRDGVLAGTNRGAAMLRPQEGSGVLVPISSDAVLSAELDREGDAWFGTDSDGMFEVRERTLGSSAALAGESVTALTAGPDGTVWAGTRDAGLRTVRAGQRTAGIAPKQFASDVVLSVAAEASEVWVGSPEGLDHLHGGRVEHITAANGLPDDFVRSVLLTRDGVVWAGTRRGVAQLRGGVVQQVLTTGDGLPSNVIGAMLQSRDGVVWIGTVSGLARWDGNVAHPVRSPARVAGAIASLFQSSSGALWVGTAGGLYLLANDRLLEVNLPELRSEVAAILEDGKGNLWLRTGAGLLRGAEAELRGCAGQPRCQARLRQFGVADGMPGVELPTLGTPVGAKSQDGTLWFATRRGAALVDPQQSSPTAVPPGIAIEEVRLDGRTVPFRPELEVGTGKRRLAVSFAGLSLRAPGQVRYRYLLAGFDRDWSPWQGRSIAEYTNLPPGRFLFRVEAMNAEGVVSSADATLPLRVAAPLYRRWWFYVALLVLACLIGYGLYWLRLRRVRRDFDTVLQERNRIAREIHDTLAQDFVAVSLQLEVTSQLLRAGAAAAAKEQIDATRTLVRDGIQDARESIWAIRAGGAEETLPARLLGVVKRISAAALLVTGAYRSLPPSQEREALRIAKEALANASKHAKAGHIRVELIYSEDAVLLRVSDDGAGFDVVAGAARTGHYGLRGMRERAAAMGALLSIRSMPGEGTCVELRLKNG